MNVTNTRQLGKAIRKQRKAVRLTQVNCAGVAGVGVRFLSDLENGKATCEIGKTFKILAVLGLRWSLDDTDTMDDENETA